LTNSIDVSPDDENRPSEEEGVRLPKGGEDIGSSEVGGGGPPGGPPEVCSDDDYPNIWDQMQCKINEYGGTTNLSNEIVAQKAGGNSAGTDTSNYVYTDSDDNYRYFISNSIPDHDYESFTLGQGITEFPNEDVTPQGEYLRMPVNPSIPSDYDANSTTIPKEKDLGMWSHAVLSNGVPVDTLPAEWADTTNNLWQYNPANRYWNIHVDDDNAHVQPDGTYHYHGPLRSTSLDTDLSDNEDDDNYNYKIIGYVGDGFPLMGPNVRDEDGIITEVKSSYKLKSETERVELAGASFTPEVCTDNCPDNFKDPIIKNNDDTIAPLGAFRDDYEFDPDEGDLDICNGMTYEENGETKYAYFLTNTYPFFNNCFTGDVDETFSG